MGVGHMISNLAEEEYKYNNQTRKLSHMATLGVGNVSFEEDIDNIIKRETEIIEEEEI